MQGQHSDPQALAEREMVHQSLVDILVEAELQADLVCRLLNELGIKPGKASVVEAGTVPSGPAADMLLNIGAALRIATWDRAGLRPFLPGDVPSTTAALRIAGDIGTGILPRSTSHNLPAQVFQVWFRDFAHDSRSYGLGEILQKINEQDDLLDKAAQFLWDNRHLSKD